MREGHCEPSLCVSLGSRLPRTAHSHALLTRSWKQPEREAPEPSAKQQGAGIEGEPGRREKSQEKGEETDKTRGGGGRRGEEKRREEERREGERETLVTYLIQLLRQCYLWNGSLNGLTQCSLQLKDCAAFEDCFESRPGLWAHFCFSAEPLSVLQLSFFFRLHINTAVPLSSIQPRIPAYHKQKQGTLTGGKQKPFPTSAGSGHWCKDCVMTLGTLNENHTHKHHYADTSDALKI